MLAVAWHMLASCSQQDMLAGPVRRGSPPVAWLSDQSASDECGSTGLPCPPAALPPLRAPGLLAQSQKGSKLTGLD